MHQCVHAVLCMRLPVIWVMRHILIICCCYPWLVATRLAIAHGIHVWAAWLLMQGSQLLIMLSWRIQYQYFSPGRKMVSQFQCRTNVGGSNFPCKKGANLLLYMCIYIYCQLKRSWLYCGNLLGTNLSHHTRVTAFMPSITGVNRQSDSKEKTLGLFMSIQRPLTLAA